MTIEKYFSTFGFIVKRESYLEHFGYTEENLPEEYKNEYYQEDPIEALAEWICDEHGLPINKQIVVDGVNYIVRGFSHDSEYVDYVVVGVDCGFVEKFTSKQHPGTNCNPTDRIRTLCRNKAWIKMIQDSPHYSYGGSPVGYSVQDPQDKNLQRIPSVHITTDDCACCS